MSNKTLIAAFFLVVIACIFMHANIIKSQNLEEGLVSYWSLDEASIIGETVKDDWGDNDGKIVGNPKTVEGKIGEALEFDGDDYIRLSPVEMPEGVTITAWVNPEAWVPPKYSEVLDTWSPGGPADWYRLGFDNTGKLECVADTGDDDSGRESTTFDASGLSGWHHVAGVRDYEAKVLRLYVDGSEVSSKPFKGTTALKPANLVIGARGDGKDEFLNGIIDEVALFNVALTEDDIKDVMINGLSSVALVSPSGKLAITWAAVKAK